MPLDAWDMLSDDRKPKMRHILYLESDMVCAFYSWSNIVVPLMPRALPEKLSV